MDFNGAFIISSFEQVQQQTRQAPIRRRVLSSFAPERKA
jgi:hypothetical protein